MQVNVMAVTVCLTLRIVFSRFFLVYQAILDQFEILQALSRHSATTGNIFFKDKRWPRSSLYYVIIFQL